MDDAQFAVIRRTRGSLDRRVRLGVLCLTMLLAAMTACVHSGGASSVDEDDIVLPVGPVPLSVENLSQYNVTVYAVRGTLRRRVGEVAALSRAQMLVPDTYTNDHGGFSLQVVMVGGPARYISDTVAPQRGERLVLTVQNRIVNSALTVLQ